MLIRRGRQSRASLAEARNCSENYPTLKLRIREWMYLAIVFVNQGGALDRTH